MPTLLEIARATGTTKPTVKKRLEDAGLWDGHVTRGPRGSYEVDDFAAAAVADSLVATRPAEASPREGGADSAALSALYEARVAELKERVASLERQLEAKDAQISELMGQLSEAQAAARDLARPRRWWQRLLGSGE